MHVGFVRFSTSGSGGWSRWSWCGDACMCGRRDDDVRCCWIAKLYVYYWAVAFSSPSKASNVRCWGLYARSFCWRGGITTHHVLPAFLITPTTSSISLNIYYPDPWILDHIPSLPFPCNGSNVWTVRQTCAVLPPAGTVITSTRWSCSATLYSSSIRKHQQQPQSYIYIMHPLDFHETPAFNYFFFRSVGPQSVYLAATWFSQLLRSPVSSSSRFNRLNTESAAMSVIKNFSTHASFGRGVFILRSQGAAGLVILRRSFLDLDTSSLLLIDRSPLVRVRRSSARICHEDLEM